MTIAVMLLLALALGTTVLLNQAKFESSLAHLQQARIAVHTSALKATIEQSTDLGLALREARGTQALVERVQAGDPAILSVTVYDDKGAALYRAARAGDDPQADAFLSEADILNPFSQRIGRIEVRQSRADYLAATDATLRELLAGASLIFAVFAILAVAGIRLAFAGLTRSARRLAAMMEAEAGQAQPLAPRNAFERELIGFNARIHRALSQPGGECAP
ncbi:hypothetical protein [Zavarzinia sp. CC-PAN008]|uniref:hypothetical protein n=1 Tax=Zavarzinia sp. CC-PAN008 TaxID=3243332 RepID=UPI003F746BE7